VTSLRFILIKHIIDMGEIKYRYGINRFESVVSPNYYFYFDKSYYFYEHKIELFCKILYNNKRLLKHYKGV
jgi:hypothetical protein